jgi:molecular chaperone GrpE
MQQEVETKQCEDNSDIENDTNLTAGDAASEQCSEEAEEYLSAEDKVVELEAKINELKDLYVRAQAEIQNVQRRSIEDIKKARDFAFSSFAKDVVVVKDYLEMALADQTGNIETLKTGVDLTLKQVVQVFERNAIKEVSPIPGDKLDPHLHQAMNSVESAGQEANTIVNVMQKGYTLNSRVLRPAMVVVAK